MATWLRNAGAWSATVRGLLRHVRAKGLLLAPEPFGVVGNSKRLRCIEGDTATSEPWPDRV